MKAFLVKTAIFTVVAVAVEVSKAVQAKKRRQAEDEQRFANAKVVSEVSTCTDLVVV